MTATKAVRAYRDVSANSRVLAASGPQLTAIVYAELADTLRLALNVKRLPAAGVRALAILDEAGAALSNSRTDSFAHRMRVIHAYAAQSIRLALAENDPEWIQSALTAIEPIAEAWGSLRPS